MFAKALGGDILGFIGEFFRDVMVIVCAGLILYLIRWIVRCIKRWYAKASAACLEEDYELIEDYIEETGEEPTAFQRFKLQQTGCLDEKPPAKGKVIAKVIIYAVLIAAVLLIGVWGGGILSWFGVDEKWLAIIRFVYFTAVAIYALVGFLASVVELIRHARVGLFIDSFIIFALVSYVAMISYFDASYVLRSIISNLFG